jgi:hypothetical protein
MDSVFVARLRRSLKYEEVYLNAYAMVAEAKAGVGAWPNLTCTRAGLSHAAANLRAGTVDMWTIGFAEPVATVEGGTKISTVALTAIEPTFQTGRAIPE